MEIKLPFGFKLFRKGKVPEIKNAGAIPIDDRVRRMLESELAEKGYIGADTQGFRGQRTQYFGHRAMLSDLYTIAYREASIKTATLNLRNEVFRRGLEWSSKFTTKCINEQCGLEFKENLDVCTTCGASTRLPNPESRERLEAFLTRANVFGQSLEDVLREVEDDINIADDAFLLLHCEYIYDEHASQLRRRVIQALRLDPAEVEFDLDNDGLPEQKTAFCPNHRTTALDIDDAHCLEADCSMPTLAAMYKYQHGGKIFYFDRDEVIHWSKYSPSKTYGYSPVLSFMEKALTLIGMDMFLYDQYYERKLPPGVITTGTTDVPGLRAEIKLMQERMKTDPSYIPWIAVGTTRGQGTTEFVKLGFTPDELQYSDVRTELRERIAALYGVTNIWMGGTEGVGGISKETQQLVVMSRVVEAAQRPYNVKVLPGILQAFGITDWDLKLLPPEETTEETRLIQEEREATIATLHYNLGFKFSKDPEGKFVYESPPEPDAVVTKPEESPALQTTTNKELLATIQNMQSVVDELEKRFQIPIPTGVGDQEEPAHRYGNAEIVGGGRARKPIKVVESVKMKTHKHPILGHPELSELWHPAGRSHRTFKHADLPPDSIEERDEAE